MSNGIQVMVPDKRIQLIQFETPARRPLIRGFLWAGSVGGLTA
jgi:hypothetical protein